MTQSAYQAHFSALRTSQEKKDASPALSDVVRGGPAIAFQAFMLYGNI